MSKAIDSSENWEDKTESEKEIFRLEWENIAQSEEIKSLKVRLEGREWVDRMGEVVQAVFDNEGSFIQKFLPNIGSKIISSFYMSGKNSVIMYEQEREWREADTWIRTLEVLDWFESLQEKDV